MSVKVAVVKTASAQYPTRSPYHPSVSYPEYPFPGCVQPEPNAAYDGVRQLFRLMRLDEEHINTKQWNPLGHIIKAGMTVVIKPNFVRSRHYDGKDLFSMITHPSVLRAVADYCWIALKKSGRIVIADAPNFDADWTELRQRLGLQELLEFFLSRGHPQVELLDLRDYWGKSRLPFFETRHMPSCERELRGDPAGAMVVNLGERSALCGFPHPEKYYGAVFDRRETIAHHIGSRQEYEVSRTIMTADVIVSVPKLKVHKRCGTTLNIKGLVGICTNKNYLVHYTLGPPSTGGDQYPDNLLTSGERRIINWERWMYDHLLAYRLLPLELVHRFIFGFLYLKVGAAMGIKIPAKKRVYEPGCWYGNDSTWRMATDLLKVAVFGDRRGAMQERPQRQFFSIVDGIIGGENKGPLTPDPVASRVLVGGENLLAVDIVATRMMGFDPLRVRMYRFLLEESEPDWGIHSLDDIEVVASPEEWQSCLRDRSSKFLDFKPHPGWVGHIEPQTGTEEHLECKTVQYP